MIAFIAKIMTAARLARALAALTRAEERGIFWSLRSSQLAPASCYLVELREVQGSFVVRWHEPVKRATPLEALEAAVAYLASPAGGAA